MKNFSWITFLRAYALFMGLLTAGGTANAEDGLGTTTLNFSFTITAGPCEVTTPPPVDLGTLYTTDFVKDGYGGTDWKAFTISAVNCPEQTNSVRVTFTGDPSPEGAADKFYANKGDAGNVDVELQTSSGKNLGNTQSETWLVNSGTKTAEIKLRARAHQMKSGEGVTAGSINTAITASFEWP